MPNKRSAEKELRKAKKRKAHHIRLQSHLKHLFKQTETLIKEGKTAEAAASLKAFQQAADKAARGHAVSVNRSKRKKSQLMRAIAPTK